MSDAPRAYGDERLSLLDAEQIEWCGSAGNYVRVHSRLRGEPQ